MRTLPPILGLTLLLGACDSTGTASDPDGRSADTDPMADTSDTDTDEAGDTDSADTDDIETPVFERVENPFDGARPYISTEYAEKVASSKARVEDRWHDALDTLAAQPTAVWLDRIAAIEGTDTIMGLRAHLDAAVVQQRAHPDEPVLVTFVVYDLPNRDCAARASNGELRLEADGMRLYQEEYIDVIAETLGSDPAYGALRVVLVLEPDSLPNLVTNLESHPECRIAKAAYEEGIAYAISAFAEHEHAYIYLDMAHSAWLGWEHGEAAAELYAGVMDEAGGPDLVTGFATNVSNYSTLEERFDPYADIGANMGVIEGFYEWNRMIDELTYVGQMRRFFPRHGFLVDTGRNGWTPRFDAPMDQRTHRGNWCNVSGAGIGERPAVAPAPGVHAFAWIKPPGESDGTSDAGASEPSDEGKRFDPMCGQDPVVREKGVPIATDALDGAPHAGHWFHDQLMMLVRNANPPLD